MQPNKFIFHRKVFRFNETKWGFGLADSTKRRIEDSKCTRLESTFRCSNFTFALELSASQTQSSINNLKCENCNLNSFSNWAVWQIIFRPFLFCDVSSLKRHFKISYRPGRRLCSQAVLLQARRMKRLIMIMDWSIAIHDSTLSVDVEMMNLLFKLIIL